MRGGFEIRNQPLSQGLLRRALDKAIFYRVVGLYIDTSPREGANSIDGINHHRLMKGCASGMERHRINRHRLMGDGMNT